MHNEIVRHYPPDENQNNSHKTMGLKGELGTTQYLTFNIEEKNRNANHLIMAQHFEMRLHILENIVVFIYKLITLIILSPLEK